MTNNMAVRITEGCTTVYGVDRHGDHHLIARSDSSEVETMYSRDEITEIVADCEYGIYEILGKRTRKFLDVVATKEKAQKRVDFMTNNKNGKFIYVVRAK